MLRNGLQGWHVLVLLVVILLLFGASRLPGLARSVGESLRIFKKEIKDVTSDGDASASATAGAPAAPAQPAAPVPPVVQAPVAPTPAVPVTPVVQPPLAPSDPAASDHKPYDTPK